MRQITIKIGIVFIASLISCWLGGQGISGLKSVIGEKDQKVVDKAISQLEEAARLTVEANDYYNEALALQSNYELDEMTLQKKLAAAEKKAVASQIKADKAYASAYSSIYDMCNRILKESSVSYGESGGLEASASDMINQAKDKRKEAERSKNPYEKAGLLNSAAEFEGAAIDMLVSAVLIESGNSGTDAVTYPDPIAETSYSEPAPIADTTPEYSEPDYSTYTSAEPVDETGYPDYEATESYTEPDYSSYESTPDVTTSEYTSYESTPLVTEASYPTEVEQKSENLSVNQEVIGKYDAYVSDPSIPDPVTLTSAGLTGIEEPSLDAARSVVRGEAVSVSQSADAPEPEYDLASTEPIAEKYVEPAVLSPVASEPAYTPEPEYVPEETTSQTPATSHVEEPVQESVYETVPVASEPVREMLDISASPQLVGINFRVQIAASKIPLTRTQLRAIYSGDKTVEVQKTGAWYRYNITGFRLFSEANQTALGGGVRDAWVTAEYQGAQLPLAEAREKTRVLEADVARYGRKVIESRYEFYVQVAASRIRLENDKLSVYCGSPGTCREIIEEDWIKYQIYGGDSYEQALQVKQQVSGEAFIVAYEMGQKQKLYQAIQK